MPGVVALLGLLASVVTTAANRIARSGWNSELAGAMAGVVAVAAVAIVDFPLARPAEVAVTWALVACVALSGRDHRTSPD